MPVAPRHPVDPCAVDRPPRWYRLYFLLAAFDVLTVCISLSVNHRLMAMYESSVGTNRVWAARLSAYANLNAWAAQANAPGNDVFESRDPDEAEARLDAKLAGFSKALAVARQELLDDIDPATASRLVVHLDRAEAAMRAQVAEARAIFAHVRAHDLKSAGQRMAAMDHAFYDVTDALASLSRAVQDLQHDALEKQAAVADSMRRIEYLIAALIALMVSLAVLYGHRLATRARATERRLRELAREAQEHRARADRHNQELTRALAQIETQKHAMDEHSIVAATDPSGKITYANDKFCEISGYARDELIGQRHPLVASGHPPPAFFEELRRTIGRGEVWHGEVRNTAKDGSTYWVDTTIVPFRDEAGDITEYVAIQTDITERKRAEAELIRAKEAAEVANRAKSEFLANMSHEIRTPMTAIRGFAENLLDADQSESERLHCIHTIRRNGEYLLGIINDILDLSKIEAGKMRIELGDCRPCHVIAEVASLMRVPADAKGLPLRIEYIGAIPETIRSDAKRLRQILINLVGNAIKFTETGSVRLVTRLVDEAGQPRLQMDVIDTGHGMTGEDRARLFQPFMQADTSATRAFGGTGLGLTISKRFAELLGGDVSVVETEAGVGSTFRVTVATGPLAGVRMLEDPMSATVVVDTAGSLAPVAPSGLGGLRILLAEDGPDNQRLISFVLKKAGAEVQVESNGKRALEAALAARDAGTPFDVILMDMQMPVMDGYEATGRLREAGYGGPIIALTAHAMAGDQEKCLEAGCDAYATKPIDRRKLIDGIVECVEAARRNMESVRAQEPPAAGPEGAVELQPEPVAPAAGSGPAARILSTKAR